MTKKKEYTWDEYGLLLLNGQEINVAAREDIFDEVYREIHMALEQNGLWYTSDWNYEVLRVTYFDYNLDCVDFKKVVGIAYK